MVKAIASPAAAISVSLGRRLFPPPSRLVSEMSSTLAVTSSKVKNPTNIIITAHQLKALCTH